MDLETFKAFFTEENIRAFLENYRDLGPLPGILLPFLESIFPVLPIFIFIAGNAAAYGLWWGFLFSWIGAFLGSIVVFVVIRKFQHIKIIQYFQNHKRVKPVTNWIDRHGFGPLFIIQCFPFSPSAFINVVAGISRMKFYQYALAVFLGKMVMVFIVSYIGHDIFSLIHNPIQLMVILAVIFLLWIAGKQLEKRLSKKIDSNI
ncbi:hypothetical protein CIB95_01100 [Lottiidibacillus patelloidae]|uniref:TVP38/TMEM64 family membrane protein n=1 Tax=Lottiidibacillus patelloidae TaxID=2670334 RepID=A0A263BWS4_9BACI|nr:TVP38/TMEM64 family protein [Lottiidibacillus patelloidae]OZM58201.1 hypothetical protein CIB95_01100 [Lottiidibacillus patelloidae]